MGSAAETVGVVLLIAQGNDFVEEISFTAVSAAIATADVPRFELQVVRASAGPTTS
jgi:hypothetical protein